MAHGNDCHDWHAAPVGSRPHAAYCSLLRSRGDDEKSMWALHPSSQWVKPSGITTYTKTQDGKRLSKLGIPLLQGILHNPLKEVVMGMATGLITRTSDESTACEYISPMYKAEASLLRLCKHCKRLVPSLFRSTQTVVQ